MEKKKTHAPPLKREELMSQLVTDTDAYTALQYLRQRDGAPAVWELEKTGAGKLPGTPAVLADTYSALWSAEPVVRAAEQVRPDRRYWQALLGQTVETSAFQELHATTEGSSLLSFVGTIEAGTTILGLVPKKDQEKLRELSEAAEQAEEAEQEACDAEAGAHAIETMAAGMPSTSGGSGSMTAAQAMALASQIAAAKANAQASRELADEAKARAESLANALMGQPGSAEAEAKLRELTRLGHGALQKAQAKVSEISEIVNGWGLEESELSRMEVPEALALLQKMRRSEALKKFASLLGRLRAIAGKKARSKIEGEGRRVTRQETGRDIARAYSSELVALAHPATRVPAIIRWARGELALRGQETKKPLGHGPVIVCEDGSGSMDGAPQQWAKGVTLSLAHFAKLRKRSFGWVMFDAVVHIAKTYPKGALAAKDLLEIVEARAGGGTSFEAPLRKAVEMIEREGLKKADIAFVTDGDCAVSTEFLEWFRGKKQQLEFNVVTVICDAGGHVSDATVKQFSDRVERVSAFSAEEAETKVFAHL